MKYRSKKNNYKTKKSKKGGNRDKISTLILNYNRPENLYNSLPELVKYDLINDIIVLNGHPDHKIIYNHPKVRCIDDCENNDNIFLFRRYKNSVLCQNNIILLLDDDLYPTQQLLNDLLNAFYRDPDNFYGPTKRLCNSLTYRNNKHNHNYILPGISLTSKSVILNTYQKMETNKKLFQKVIKQKGNCEDLFFNYEFNKLYKKLPVYIKGKYITLNKQNGFSTTNSKHHYKIRNDFCKLLN